MAGAQISIQSRAGKRKIRARDWSTFSKPHPKIKNSEIFKRWGIVKEFHSNHLILCDYDTQNIPNPNLFSLAHTLGLTIVSIRWDKTRRGWHQIIRTANYLSDAEIIACTLILGSDPDRARLDLKRAISHRLRPSKFWHKRISILFSRKVKVKPWKRKSGTRSGKSKRSSGAA
jgi:hypothetical protein